jgi:hypothetical protein
MVTRTTMDDIPRKRVVGNGPDKLEGSTGYFSDALRVAYGPSWEHERIHVRRVWGEEGAAFAQPSGDLALDLTDKELCTETIPPQCAPHALETKREAPGVS